MKKKLICLTTAVLLILLVAAGGLSAVKAEEPEHFKSTFTGFFTELFSYTDSENKIEELTEQRNKLEKENQRLKERIQELKKKIENLPENKEDKAGKTAYLTFDDGPSHNTQEVLDILQDYDIQATFFVVGLDTPFGHKMYQRMAAEGHAVGNHTYTHNFNKIYQSPENFMADFKKLEELLYKVIGIKPDILRFPGGSRSASALEAAGYDVIHYIIKDLHAEGYKYYDWNVSADDAVQPEVSKEEIVQNVFEGAQGKEKALILFHDDINKETTVEALPEIIEGLQEMGYSFDVLSKDGFCVQFAR